MGGPLQGIRIVECAGYLSAPTASYMLGDLGAEVIKIEDRERGDPTYAAFKGRVFAIASASPGATGGLRSLMALRQILELGCGALVIPEQVAVQQAETAFDDMDNIIDSRTANLLRTQLARLVDMARLIG